MRTIKFIVHGKPTGKGRPRFVSREKYVQTYTPEATRKYEKLVQMEYLMVADKNTSENAVRMEIKAIFEPPKSISKKKRDELIGKPYLHKPDGDNIIKIICDALNGIAYKDDKQIYLVAISKVYGEESMVEVEIEYE